MSSGQLGEEFDKDMSFKLNVSQFRRRKLLESMMADTKEKKEKGSRILQNFKKQVMNHPNLRDTLSESKKSSNFMYGLDCKGKRTK